MSDFGKYLKKLRGERSLREMERLTGLSHTYLSTLEKGIDPRSKKERKPTPDVLKKLADSLSINYYELMEKAGYIDENKYVIVENKNGNGAEWFTGAKAYEHWEKDRLLQVKLNDVQLDPNQFQKNKKSDLPITDLILHLNRDDITYLGEWLSLEDRMKIMKALEELFPKQVEEFKNKNNID